MPTTPTRIKDLSTTATTLANDDYVVVDGVTNGTRKALPSASGRTVLTGTPAEARAAIGMPDKVPGIYIIGSSTASNERPGTT